MEQQASESRTPNFQMWIDPEVLHGAEILFSSYGFTVAEAITVFLRESRNTGGLPFLLSPEGAKYTKEKAMDQFLAEVEDGWESVETGGWQTLDEVKDRLGTTHEGNHKENVGRHSEVELVTHYTPIEFDRRAHILKTVALSLVEAGLSDQEIKEYLKKAYDVTLDAYADNLLEYVKENSDPEDWY